MAINVEKIAQVINTWAFAEALKNVRSVEDIQAVFAANGVELSRDEVIRVANDIVAENASDLSADVLDEVYGGCINQGSHNFSKAIYWLPNIISRGCGKLKFRWSCCGKAL